MNPTEERIRENSDDEDLNSTNEFGMNMVGGMLIKEFD